MSVDEKVYLFVLLVCVFQVKLAFVSCLCLCKCSFFVFQLMYVRQRACQLLRIYFFLNTVLIFLRICVWEGWVGSWGYFHV